MPRRNESARSSPARNGGHTGRDRSPPASTAPNASGGRTTAPVRRPAPLRLPHSPATPAPSPPGRRFARIVGGAMVDLSFSASRPTRGPANHIAGQAGGEDIVQRGNREPVAGALHRTQNPAGGQIDAHDSPG